MRKIKVGFLLSYDYNRLKKSIPAVYKYSDAIYLAIDKNLRTWSGEVFVIDNNFFLWLKKFDTENKIIIYKDNFFKPELSPIQNDTRERHMLSIKMGIGNWLIQIDADEIFIDFKKFIDTLRKYDHYLKKPKTNPIQVSGFLINIYKYLDDGILYVKKPTKVLLATNFPNYKLARKTKERIIYTDNLLIHESLSRDEEELKFKLNNWGHTNELNKSFFCKWKSANKYNYHKIKNTFYLDPKVWKDLEYFNQKDLNEFKKTIHKTSNLRISKVYLIRKNFGQWFKHLKIFK
ncbi:MAG: hypothetical protein ACTIKA_08625 [Psychroflexus halocasei]|uniref:hypothetical protein n=1 Tax=Psychroflexus sp. S27 TaxID=1982757 RepID=UPI000C2A0D8A|nr:hypothetical protein [Psychroflexus sp. S27]PJX20751.1 hypothetical protein CAP47_10950 [Psychroflexus sp. S27]